MPVPDEMSNDDDDMMMKGPWVLGKALMTFSALTGKSRRECDNDKKMAMSGDMVEGFMYLNR